MSPPTDPPSQPATDAEHLRLLVLFHYILAGIVALFACFPLIHVTVGAFMVGSVGIMPRDAFPVPVVGVLFMVIGGTMVLLGWTAAVCTYLSGRYLAERRKRTFSFVTAAVLCAFMPLGTVLGVFTLIVLSRPSVQRLYADRGA